MPRNLRIFLVRHGESTANLDNSVNTVMADHAIPLSDLGYQQANVAGLFLRKYLLGLPDEFAHDCKSSTRLWRSPYQRTRQTADEMLVHLTNLVGDVREKSNLREQEFGLFDGVPDHELSEKFPLEYEHYKKSEDAQGRFWARMPLGESRCDVAERVHAVFGTFHRDAERHGIDNIIVVSHGVTIRAFVYAWMGYPWEWFETAKNPPNCSIWLLENGKDKGLIFNGKTWYSEGHAQQERREDGRIL